jgi:hypothetical protein
MSTSEPGASQLGLSQRQDEKAGMSGQKRGEQLQ